MTEILERLDSLESLVDALMRDIENLEEKVAALMDHKADNEAFSFYNESSGIDDFDGPDDQ
jgi:hypothetical protein